MAIGPKKMAGEGEAGGNRWRGGSVAILLLAGRQNFLAEGHFFAPIVGGEAICSFLKEY